MSFDKILEFERKLSEFTNSPYVVMTDCCTHAIEICLRYTKVKSCKFTAHTYLSIPMLMHKLGIKYEYTNDEWIGEYKFHNTNIWDSARRLEAGMFKQGMMQCLSFGWDKPLSIGRGGAILLDDLTTYKDLIKMRYDGRDLSISPWHSQRIFKVGYHYKPLIEEAEKGLKLLDILKLDKPRPKYVQYPDLRTITIID